MIGVDVVDGAGFRNGDGEINRAVVVGGQPDVFACCHARCRIGLGDEVAAGVVDVVNGADGAARRSGCPRHHQLKRVVAVGGVGRPVAGDRGQAVPVAIAIREALAGAGLRQRVAAGVVSVSSESGAVFCHARDPVGDGIIG